MADAESELNVVYTLTYSAVVNVSTVLKALRLRSRSSTLNAVLYKAIHVYLPWEVCLMVKDILMGDVREILAEREERMDARYDGESFVERSISTNRDSAAIDMAPHLAELAVSISVFSKLWLVVPN